MRILQYAARPSWALAGTTVLALAALAGSLAPAPGHADSAVAKLEMRITDIRFERDGNRREFHHVREITETAGVDATLTMGKACFSNGECNTQPVNYRIPADGRLRLENQYLLSLTEREFYAITYTGRDANGNDIALDFTLVVNDDELTLQD